jgi:hypothetical protein
VLAEQVGETGSADGLFADAAGKLPAGRVRSVWGSSVRAGGREPSLGPGRQGVRQQHRAATGRQTGVVSLLRELVGGEVPDSRNRRRSRL